MISVRVPERLRLIKLEGAVIDPALDGLGLEQLQPLRDELERRLRGGLRVGESAQTALPFGRESMR